MAVAGSLLLVGATRDGAEAARGSIAFDLLLTGALRQFACSGTGGHRRQGSCGWIDLAGFWIGHLAVVGGEWIPRGNWLAAARWDKAPNF